MTIAVSERGEWKMLEEHKAIIRALKNIADSIRRPLIEIVQELDIIQNTLAAQNIDIVHCKDCKWYKDDGCFFSTAEFKGDDFCSYGERK